LAGFARGVDFVRELLSRYWADIHPLLDAEDNNDPTVRLNTLSALEAPKGAAAAETLLRDLRDAALFPPTPRGKVTVRDLLVIDGRLPAGETAPSEVEVDDALRAAVAADPDIAGAAARSVEAVRQLRSVVAEHVGSELAPDVSAVLDMLSPVAHRMARLFGQTAGEEAGVDVVEGGGPGFGGSIRGRDDVLRAIDAICAYLERTEPANPAPLLLRRAQRLLNKSFVELIADLAPDGVAQVKLIAGLKDDAG
jgi:type VI secretion system protein ImpA